MSFSPLISRAVVPGALAATGKRRVECFERLECCCPVAALQARLVKAFWRRIRPRITVNA